MVSGIVCVSFNPRTRDGCELLLLATARPTTSFNPRTRDGCEGWVNDVNDAYEVSIHAPVMGSKSL